MTTIPDRKKLGREAKAPPREAGRTNKRASSRAGAWHSATAPSRMCTPARLVRHVAATPAFSRISDAEMNVIMKNAVNCVCRLLRLKTADPAHYGREIAFGELRHKVGRA
jgi:hypothetical protein